MIETIANPPRTLVEIRSNPFKHAVIAELLPANDAESLLLWLEQTQEWTLRSKSFYTHYAIDLAGLLVHDATLTICSRYFLLNLRNLMQECFGVAFAKGVAVWAHKQIIGQGIGPHTDRSQDEYRLVLQLNRGWTPRNGGLCLLFNQGLPIVAYAPMCNSAIAFRTDNKAFHAVTEVIEGTRYSIVFVFRAE